MSDVIAAITPLGFPWPTLDPFLFCVHHDDSYPAGNNKMGLDDGDLTGRNLGSDFVVRDGWRMYHGEVVPGFPRHPHRGFETVTLARKGNIDHSDSMGATARFGHGDVQWMTAGKGIVHAEMFPLVNRDQANPTELFQLWLNLPAHDKMVEPHFTMLWADTIPRHVFKDEAGRQTEVVVVAGQVGDMRAPSPPPNSWAAKPSSHVGIWTIRMAPGARWVVPPTAPRVNRVLYPFIGKDLVMDGQVVDPPKAVQVRPDAALTIINGPEEAEILLLQGMPISEPVARHGPFVMNTRVELQQAYADYRATEFGGWPWDRDDPVHDRDQPRFAVHAGGRKEGPV